MFTREIGFLEADSPKIEFGRELTQKEFEDFLTYASEKTGYTIAGMKNTFFLSKKGNSRSSIMRTRYAVADEENKRIVYVSPILERKPDITMIRGMSFYTRHGYDVEDDSFGNPSITMGLEGKFNRNEKDPLLIAENLAAQSGYYFMSRAAS